MSATPLAHQSRSRPRPTRCASLYGSHRRCGWFHSMPLNLLLHLTGRAERHFVNTIKAAQKCCYRPPTRTTLAARLFDCFEKGTRKASPQQQTRASGGQAPRKSASYWRKQCPAGEFDAKSKDSALHFGRPDTLGEDKGHGSQVPPGTFYRNHTHPYLHGPTVAILSLCVSRSSRSNPIGHSVARPTASRRNSCPISRHAACLSCAGKKRCSPLYNSSLLGSRGSSSNVCACRSSPSPSAHWDARSLPDHSILRLRVRGCPVSLHHWGAAVLRRHGQANLCVER